MMAMTSAPRLYLPSSEASGRFTLMMMSASLTASALTVAPAAVNSESGSPDLMPAPGSTATSTPRALNFFTVSGDAATRGSEGSISLATAIFIRPPAARGAREQTSAYSTRIDTGLRPERFLKSRRRAAARSPHRAGQEEPHHGDDEDDGESAVFHQHDDCLLYTSDAADE